MITSESVSSIDINSLENELLRNTNKMLNNAGLVDTLNAVKSIEELQKVASSMFVAVYEARFHIRLEEIIRNPNNELDNIYNSNILLNHLQNRINMKLKHISGLSIAQGNLKALYNLVRIFLHLLNTQG